MNDVTIRFRENGAGEKEKKNKNKHEPREISNPFNWNREVRGTHTHAGMFKEHRSDLQALRS